MNLTKINCCQYCRSLELKDKPMVYIGLCMLICNECGNKRCPKAQDHRYLCSNSNEPNQIGTLK